jgi:hypothetical protein
VLLLPQSLSLESTLQARTTCLKNPKPHY